MTSDLGILTTYFPVLEQCLCNRLQGDEIVLEWVAFSTTKGGLKLSLNTLEQFEHEVGERHMTPFSLSHTRLVFIVE